MFLKDLLWLSLNPQGYFQLQQSGCPVDLAVLSKIKNGEHLREAGIFRADIKELHANHTRINQHAGELFGHSIG